MTNDEVQDKYYRMVRRIGICRKFGETLLRIGISKDEYDNTLLSNLRVRINKVTSLDHILQFVERHEEAKRFPEKEEL